MSARRLLIVAVGILLAALFGLAALQYRMPAGFTCAWCVNYEGARHFAQHLFGRMPAPLPHATFAFSFQLALVMAWVGYALLVVAGLQGGVPERKRLLPLLLIVPVLFAVFCPPSLSVDAYGYVAYARMQVLHGWNPYMTLPTRLKEIGDPVAEYLAWNHSTPYGSCWTLLSLGIVGVLRSADLWWQVVVMKLLEAAALVGAAFAGRRIAARLCPERADLTLLAIGLNPLLLLEGPGNGHNDLAMLCCLLWAVSLCLEKRRTVGLLLLGLSIGIKLVTLAALPWILWEGLRGKRPREAGGVALATLLLTLAPLVVCFAPFWQGTQTLRGAGLEQRAAAGASPERLANEAALRQSLLQQGVPAAVVPPLVSAARQWPLLMLYVGLSLWVSVRKAVEDWLMSWVILTSAPALLFVGIWFPWYYSWAWPIALLRWDRRFLTLSWFCLALAFLATLRYTGI